MLIFQHNEFIMCIQSIDIVNNIEYFIIIGGKKYEEGKYNQY